MSRLLFILFSTWFLILPFTVVSSVYLEMNSIDKLLAPLLIFLWIVFFFIGAYRFGQKKIAILTIALGLFFARNLNLIDDFSLFLYELWQDAIRFGYFCLPVLYINSVARVKVAANLISINAVVGCLSALMVALGLLSLPYERFAISRIGLDIDKSIGLISTYGDLAQYAAVFLLLVVFVPKVIVGGEKTKWLLRILAFSIIVAGLIGTQSRSYFLSINIALFVGLVFYYRAHKVVDSLLFNVFTGIGISVLIALVAVFLVDIVQVLSELGGKQAHGTAMDRLGQYRYAFSLIRENPILGVDGAYYAKYGDAIHGIHNFWLSQLARGGVISFAPLLALFYMIYRSVSRLFWDEATKPQGIMMIGYLSAVMVSTQFYAADSSLFWALLGMMTAVATTLKTKPEPK